MKLKNGSIIVTKQRMPWGEEAVVAKYDENSDSRLHGYSAMIIKDSRITTDFDADEQDRLTTMIVRFPRCILSEMNTHRVFSRNSASSRARSLKTTIKQVMDDPYIPLFTENAKGMQGPFITDGTQLAMAKKEWLFARDSAVKHAMRMLLGDDIDPKQRRVSCISHSYPSLQSSLDMYYTDYYGKGNDIPNIIPNVHKQTANRLLEPFMWHEMLITSSYWENFFTLRMDEAAQPEMQAIATLMYVAYHESQPVKRGIHAPFMPAEETDAPIFDWDTIKHLFGLSAAECARISYHDRSTMDNKSQKTGHDLVQRLYTQGHMSPFEHQAISLTKARDFVHSYGSHKLSMSNLHGNFSGYWVQYRRVLEWEKRNERTMFSNMEVQ